MATIRAINSGAVATIDDGDAEALSRFVWRADFRKRSVYFYTLLKSGKRKVYLHRLVMGAADGFEVDHVNHDTRDNRRSNLRVCTRAENQANKVAMSRTGYKGVYFERAEGGWRAAIDLRGRGGKRIRTGRRYPTAREAALAYDELARQHFGEFALTNFPARRTA